MIKNEKHSNAFDIKWDLMILFDVAMFDVVMFDVVVQHS